jgi:thioredoxin 1
MDKGHNIMRTLITLMVVAVVGTVLPLATQTKITIPPPAAPRVTFVELGSVKCVPCRRMQPVMKAVEDKYGDQIKVVFIDVWQEENREEARKYRVRLIPTQVFLDEQGKEILRHEGYFPEEDIDEFLQSRGLTPRPVRED